MKKLVIAALFAVAASAVLADNPHGLPPGLAKKLAACEDCAIVQSVKEQKRKGEGGAVGIIAGAAAGGLLGNQVGKGNGKTLATVGGAVAGGFAGNEVQKHVTSKKVWVTEVKMRDGSLHKYEQEAKPSWKSGSVVRVNGKSLVARSAT
jgi:outer membrane lipoprotein SlyB